MVTGIDITSNGRLALIGTSSGKLSLINLENPEIVQTFANTESGMCIRFVCISGDDVRFVYVDQMNRIELRCFNINEARIELGQAKARVTCITALGLNYVLLGCDDGELVLFHLNDKSQYEFRAHWDSISQVKGELGGLCPRFASGSIGGSVKLWNFEENLPALIWSDDNIYSDPITALAFVPRSNDILVGSGGRVRNHALNEIIRRCLCVNRGVLKNAMMSCSTSYTVQLIQKRLSFQNLKR